MLMRILAFLNSDAGRRLVDVLLAAILGGVAALEFREPTFTRFLFRQESRVPDDAQVRAAIGRLSIGRTGCTGTLVGPIGPRDSQVRVLTAAHCIQVGQAARMRLNDGREFSLRCVARDADADAAWLIGERPKGTLPFALLSDHSPAPGATVWHAGFGVHVPGNVERGKVIGEANAGRQIAFHLSVSPGDSGGGIVMDSGSRIISPVCCTTRLGGPGTVYGATPAVCRALMPTVASNAEPEDTVKPIRQLPDPEWPNSDE